MLAMHSIHQHIFLLRFEFDQIQNGNARNVHLTATLHANEGNKSANFNCKAVRMTNRLHIVHTDF